MTVMYSHLVSKATFFGFHRLLLRWKGSIWKAIWMELLLWIVCYMLLSVLYKFLLPEDGRKIFEMISIYVYTFVEFIPLNFMLGFYVTAVFGRWTNFLSNIGLIDTPALFIASNIRGTDHVAVNIRKTLIRYIALFHTIVFYYISMGVKKRFPNTEKMVEAGIMTQEESNIFNNLESSHAKFWLPAQWIFNLLRKAKDLNLFESDFIYMNVMDIDIYIPVMTIFQLIFYLGWMKAAEVMINPFGTDDDDFEINYILDRNLDVGYLIVDECYDSLPCEPYLNKNSNAANGVNKNSKNQTKNDPPQKVPEIMITIPEENEI